MDFRQNQEVAKAIEMYQPRPQFGTNAKVQTEADRHMIAILEWIRDQNNRNDHQDELARGED